MYKEKDHNANIEAKTSTTKRDQLENSATPEVSQSRVAVDGVMRFVEVNDDREKVECQLQNTTRATTISTEEVTEKKISLNSANYRANHNSWLLREGI